MLLVNVMNMPLNYLQVGAVYSLLYSGEFDTSTNTSRIERRVFDISTIM